MQLNNLFQIDFGILLSSISCMHREKVCYFGESISITWEEISNNTLCLVIQFVPSMISIPSKGSKTKSFFITLLPNYIGTYLIS
jgi:hypothetical protein